MFSTVKSIARLATNKLHLPNVARCLSSKAVSRQHPSYQDTVQQTYGQPVPRTHPHLLKSDELVTGIKLDEFQRRRSRFMEKIAKTGYETPLEANPHIVIIPAASKVYMSDHIPYVFRQNTDFFYFTGCQEPDSILVMTVKGDKRSAILFMRYKDSHAELWDGPRTGVDEAQSMFGVEETLPIGDFEHFVLSYMTEHKKAIIWYDKEEVIQTKIHNKLNEIVKLSHRQSFNCPKTLVHQLRLIKSPSEIELMKKTCEIASKAIAKTMEVSVPGMSEHELFATVDYQCRMKGAEFLAYPPVVAGGKNATIIHYIANNQIVQDKEMILMDAGCEYRGYTSDITRTWPINGTFTREQRILYEIVLDVQKILIDKLKDMPSLDMIYNEMCHLLGVRLQEELLIPKDLNGSKLLAAAYAYCPHHVSHYLGMDVHDTSKISRSIRVQPGMVVTVEPGIYVDPKNTMAPREFHNLGIRIEDDVLVQENAPLILSSSCPKEVAEIESLAKMNQSK
ncbi:hypothetical protein TKK_0003722 [Trichogramma kaykai]|uniref:Aminopeptidase P N-terminal domain-containing protein n=1 Tax=Trichogramma kaykai TaxID=54128 RepID=A0ABD2XNR0_9HYME